MTNPLIPLRPPSANQAAAVSLAAPAAARQGVDTLHSPLRGSCRIDPANPLQVVRVNPSSSDASLMARLTALYVTTYMIHPIRASISRLNTNSPNADITSMVLPFVKRAVLAQGAA